MGVGWEIEVGAIERATTPYLDYGAEKYVFRNAAGLSNLASQDNSTFYQQNEASFLRFRKLSSNSDVYWEITDKIGNKYLFGETSTARQQDASNPPRIFKWCLDRIEDVNGNYITFSYSKDGGQIYLAEIEYAARLNTPPTNSVEFITEKRDDQFDSYSLGFAVRTALRSKSIEVRTNGILVKRYCRRSSNGTETFANRFVQ